MKKYRGNDLYDDSENEQWDESYRDDPNERYDNNESADGYGGGEEYDIRDDSKRRNRSLRVLTVIFAGLMTAAITYAVYYANVHKDTMLNNSYNSHQTILAQQNRRGTIYSDSGDVLADTVDNGDSEKRDYPYGALFAHAVGFDSNGRSGLEAAANLYLISSHADMDDKIANEANGDKYPGDNVVSTYNVDLQQIAYDSLGVYKGAVIVSEPSTGKILAMVSKPDFDPNTISEEWDKYTEDNESGVLVNRATQGLYPPGSTFKIMTALEYIRENPDTYNDYSYTCTGHFSYGGDKISCYHGTSHGKVDFKTSFAKSCNCSFANIGLTLDRGSFADTLTSLMFNGNLPFDMNYSKSSVLMSDDISDSDMIQASIGQGRTQMSPLHLNLITDAIANGGILMKPYEIDHVETSEGKTIKQFSPEEYGTLMTADESSILTDMMKDVVEEGTGKKLKDADYTAAGKTGSAEYDNIKGDSHAWFTGFAPVESPKICVTVIIEGAGSGGDYAVPVAKRIFDKYFENRDTQ